MHKSNVENAIDDYIAGKYKKLLKDGTLGIIREMMAKVIYARVWAKKKDWELTIPADTNVTDLPYLNPEEKVNLVIIAARQTVYVRKIERWRGVYYYNGHVYAKPYFKFIDRKANEEVQLRNLSIINAPVEAVHEVGIYEDFPVYSSAVKTFANKLRMLTVMYRDSALYGADELALLKDSFEKLQPRAVVPVTNMKTVPSLTI